MAIKIIDDEPDIVLTRSEHDQLHREWETYRFYHSDPPSFESFVRQRKHNETMQARLQGSPYGNSGFERDQNGSLI